MNTCTRSEPASSSHPAGNLSVPDSHPRCTSAVSSEQQTWAFALKPESDRQESDLHFPSRRALAVPAAAGLALQSLDGTVLLEFRLVKLSMQRWNFFMTRAPSSQLHSEYGKPIHLHKYSGSSDDVL